MFWGKQLDLLGNGCYLNLHNTKSVTISIIGATLIKIHALQRSTYSRLFRKHFWMGNFIELFKTRCRFQKQDQRFYHADLEIYFITFSVIDLFNCTALILPCSSPLLFCQLLFNPTTYIFIFFIQTSKWPSIIRIWYFVGSKRVSSSNKNVFAI